MAWRHSSQCGATFVVWLLVASLVFFGVIASLLSGDSAQYARAVEEARSREALYLAEGGLAWALARARAGEPSAGEGLSYNHGRGRVTVTVTGGADGALDIRSEAVLRQAQREWSETVTARLAGVGAAARLTNYHWTQNYD